jgi:hypothetical protein
MGRHRINEVCELWAGQKAYHASNYSENVFFYGDTIYSYGKHFPMARLIRVGGKTYVLKTARSSSVTTSHHMLSAFVAARYKGYTGWEVPELRPDTYGHSSNVQHFKDEIATLAARARRARAHRKWKTSRLKTYVDVVNDYLALFEVVTPWSAPEIPPPRTRKPKPVPEGCEVYEPADRLVRRRRTMRVLGEV